MRRRFGFVIFLTNLVLLAVVSLLPDAPPTDILIALVGTAAGGAVYVLSASE